MVQHSLFPPPGGVIDLGPLHGASQAKKLEIVGDAVYAAKCFLEQRPRTLVSEPVCAELALLFGLPIPAYRHLAFQGTLWFALEWRPDHRQFAPGMQYQLVNADCLAAMFAFDVLVCNWDRNLSNIVFQKVSPALERYRFNLIDHSHALGGDEPDNATFISHLKPPDGYLQYWPELRSLIPSWNDFEPLLRKVEALTASDVTQVVGAVPAEWRPKLDESQMLTDFLGERASNLRSLVQAAAHMFPTMT